MLDNTYSITHNTNSVTLTRIKEEGYSSEYRGEFGDDKFNLSIKHTFANRGEPGDSHMARLDVEHYDATTGELIRVPGVWRVFKTFEGTQNTAQLQQAADALDTLVDAAFIAKIIAGES
jgi:hypothetical protein